MTRHEAPPGVGAREILRWWPVIVLVALVAVAGSLLALSQRAAEYTAVARLVVVPLVQWDQAFLGTSLARDAGDAGRTAETVAGMLDAPRVAQAAAADLGPDVTPDTVAAAVDVAVLDGTNLIEVTARGADPVRTGALAEAFAAAVVADRWRTIAGELDARIALLAATTRPVDTGREAEQWLVQLRVVRAGGVDPTMRVDSTTPAAPVPRLPAAAVIALAAAGGLFVGALAAAGIAVLVRQRRTAVPHTSNGSPVTVDQRTSVPSLRS